MVLKTSTMRPTPRSTQSHAHPPPLSITSTTPHARIAASVGQSHPPHLRSPRQDDRSSSPNYFGLAVNPTNERESAVGAKNNWSPPTSSILSFGAASPKHLPIDSNPEFEAFRKQSESNHSFNLGHGNLSHFASTPGPAGFPPKLDRRQSIRAEEAEPSPKPRHIREASPDAMDVDGGRDSAYESSSTSKKTSNASLNSASFFNIPRQQSPANMMSPAVAARNPLSHLDDRHPQLSLPPKRADRPPHLKLQSTGQHRAGTLPPTLEDGPVMIKPTHFKDLLDRLPSSDFLLLDLRVFPQFSSSRIQDALNLCIPTTLLKRPSFNLKKLQETFNSEEERARFAQWSSAQYIIVYEAFSSDKKDAVSAVNTLKKFTNEGWKGKCYILRGGFNEFSKMYPHMVDRRSTQDIQSSSKVSLSLGTSIPVAPVAGGCALPATKNAANPFFSNIRQNQDLIGGVGQMNIKIPEEIQAEFANSQTVLPNWLLQTGAKDDHGKKVSDKFLNLEIAEQSRMTKALSNGVTYGTRSLNNGDVQIAGVEKGGKNRYNNIWPFEHARVKLQGKQDGACDYVNASHIKASRSNKKYIASQGPLPATFGDFWSVIWDQDVRVIVMLTAERESGQLKCHPYWSSNNYGPIKLSALSEKKVSLDPSQHRRPADRRDSGRRRAMTTTTETAPPLTPAEQPHVIVRKFSLSHGAHPFSPIREITQLHYSSWPDFGAPASASQLLSLVELSNQMQRAASSATTSPRSSDPENDQNTRPMLVHCSAGCGRTGTFCTVDSVIDMLKRQRKEAKSGVTPMDVVTASDSGDYMGKGKKASEVDGSWVFDQDTDLIQRTVEDFRGQRLSMVQSLRQYVLCYETILEWMAQQYGKREHQRSGSVGINFERSA